MSWTSNSYTDAGKVRSLNEDSILPLDMEHLWVVADGMGGHQCGDYASQLVVASLAQYQSNSALGPSINDIVESLSECNERLVTKAQQENADVIGCTVATLQLHASIAVCTWCGDSRIYRIRQGELRHLTQDHSHRCAFDDRDIIRYPQATGEPNEMLTAAIGGEKAIHLEHCTYTVFPDDIFVLCTDGLYKEVSDEDLLTIVHSSDSRESMIEKLSTLYLDRGARDNVGIIVVSTESH